MDWLLPADVTPSDALREVVGGHPLVAEILARRGITDPETAHAFLDPDAYRPAPPGEIPDLAKAADLLFEAIQHGKKILVWGDFDVDGQTSTALLVDGLTRLKANTAYHIPNRLTHGHGVQSQILTEFLQQGFEVVLTCDTGVAEHEAAQTARQAGATMIVTDHHTLPPELPDAAAVVTPQRLPEGHPLRDLPGVGVSYLLMQQLYSLSRRGNETRQFLDLAALGIVSDVATQQNDTRYLLQRGIDLLRFPQRVGLQALMKTAQVDPTNLSADTIGFQIGPRLNALGRLDDAQLAVELLITSDETHAQQIAAQLEVLNARRRQIEDQIYAAAQEQIARDPALLNFEALVLGGPFWHSGVIGIVAARLVEKYHRPTVLLVAPEEGVARGSARSVPGVDIGAAFAACSDLLISHGGHPGAAGLSLQTNLIPQFRRQLSTIVRERRDPSAINGRAVDAVVGLGQIGMELVQELNRLAPFGAGNPPVALMARNVQATTDAVFGNGKHRKLTVEDDHGAQQILTWWRGSEHPAPPARFDVLFIPRMNDYKGSVSLQLEWLDARPVPGAVVETGPRYRLFDVRAEPVAISDLAIEDYLIWVEADSVEGFTESEKQRVVNRTSQQAGRALVIWSIPPGPQELAQMLDQTRAKDVYVMARHAPDNTASAFLERLAGLVKYARRAYQGETTIPKLASATAQREVTVRRGLEWLAAKGQIGVEWLDDDRVRFAPGGAADDQAARPVQDDLKALLAETAAFRAYFKQADLNTLFQL